jgi:hypothetical protein
LPPQSVDILVHELPTVPKTLRASESVFMEHESGSLLETQASTIGIEVRVAATEISSRAEPLSLSTTDQTESIQNVPKIRSSTGNLESNNEITPPNEKYIQSETNTGKSLVNMSELNCMEVEAIADKCSTNYSAQPDASDTEIADIGPHQLHEDPIRKKKETRSKLMGELRKLDTFYNRVSANVAVANDGPRVKLDGSSQPRVSSSINKGKD